MDLSGEIADSERKNKDILTDEITAFVDSDRTDFTEFIASLYSDDNVDAVENSRQVTLLKPYRSSFTSFPNGVFEGVWEADFNSFSFSLLKEKSEDERVQGLAVLLQELFDSEKDVSKRYRLKKLKIALFLNLRFVLSPLFNAKAFQEINEAMRGCMARLTAFARENAVVLSSAYDSVAWVKPKRVFTAEELSKVAGASLKLRHYSKVVKFYNVALFESEDGGKISRTTRTSTDGMKEGVCRALLENDFLKATTLISECGAGLKKKREYLTELTEARESVLKNG